jgi:hypothetical protein
MEVKSESIPSNMPLTAHPSITPSASTTMPPPPPPANNATPNTPRRSARHETLKKHNSLSAATTTTTNTVTSTTKSSASTTVGSSSKSAKKARNVAFVSPALKSMNSLDGSNHGSVSGDAIGMVTIPSSNSLCSFSSGSGNFVPETNVSDAAVRIVPEMQTIYVDEK